MVDLLTGKAAKDALTAQQNSVQAAQRTSLAQMAAQQGDLDQATAGQGKRKQGRGLLTFLSGTGQATLG